MSKSAICWSRSLKQADNKMLLYFCGFEIKADYYKMCVELNNNNKRFVWWFLIKHLSLFYYSFAVVKETKIISKRESKIAAKTYHSLL